MVNKKKIINKKIDYNKRAYEQNRITKLRFDFGIDDNKWNKGPKKMKQWVLTMDRKWKKRRLNKELTKILSEDDRGE